MPGISCQVGAEFHGFVNFSEGEAKRPVAVVVFGNHADALAAGVGGIVLGAVVVDSPIQELRMTVAADTIQVEEVRHSELAGRNSKRRTGRLVARARGPRSDSTVSVLKGII